MSLEVGKIYKLVEKLDPGYYSLKGNREFVARFEAIVVDDEGISPDILHKFLVSDGRVATLRLKDWIVEDGSELIWALG
jgi:hypothetical protein